MPAIDFFTKTADMIEPGATDTPNNPAQRATEISEEIEILRARSVNYSDKAARILSNATGQLKVVLDPLNMLVRGARPKQSRKFL
jgi:hypothetical protein